MRHSVKFMTLGHTGRLNDTWSILNETPTNRDALVFNLLWIWLLPERLLTAYDTRIITSLSNDRTEKMARTRRTSTIILSIDLFFLSVFYLKTLVWFKTTTSIRHIRESVQMLIQFLKHTVLVTTAEYWDYVSMHSYVYLDLRFFCPGLV